MFTAPCAKTTHYTHTLHISYLLMLVLMGGLRNVMIMLLKHPWRHKSTTAHYLRVCVCVVMELVCAVFCIFDMCSFGCAVFLYEVRIRFGHVFAHICEHVSAMSKNGSVVSV